MKGRPSAFTLVELLAVTAVIGVLFAVALPALNSILESTNLTQAGQSLTDQVNLARQLASARNQTVDIRLVKKSAATPGFQAIQLWTAEGPATSKPLGKMVDLPKGTLISEETTKLSKALSQATKGTMLNRLDPTTTVSYVGLQIRPSGIVTPTLAMNQLFLTVVTAKNAGASDFPKNYMMVQINPLTGTPITYRP